MSRQKHVTPTFLGVLLKRDKNVLWRATCKMP